ncbi:MAG: GMC family oxidoreductase, partial [bacterium]|nr:GMC family oxidoreductase [bacterium]
MQVIGSPKIHDAVIVGSGAGGGTAAQHLTAAGLDVVMLEAGPELDPLSDYNSHSWPYEFSDRGRRMNARLGGWRLPGEPYEVAQGNQFRWWRARTLGGRTNNWGRHSYRMAEWDFRPLDRYGIGVNWPIGYKELAPYYDRAEEIFAVSGSRDGIPSLPDGNYLPPMKPKCHEALLARGAAKLGIPMIPARRAILTVSRHGLPACHWCGACNRGCLTGSGDASIRYSTEPALTTGRLGPLTMAMARPVTGDGR